MTSFPYKRGLYFIYSGFSPEPALGSETGSGNDQSALDLSCLPKSGCSKSNRSSAFHLVRASEDLHCRSRDRK